MSKAKFDVARELIIERRYDEARALLKTMNHAAVEKWLAKLDEIDPPFPDEMVRSRTPQHINADILQRLITIICRGYLAMAVVCFGGAALLTAAVLIALRQL